MATAREIRSRMKSVGNIGKITKAMKMVAAARLRRAQEKAAASVPYAVKIKDVLSSIVSDPSILAGLNAKKHPLLQKRAIKKVGFLVVCSDKGLAGAYSSNALKLAVAEIAACDQEAVVITAGRRARDFFMRRGYKVLSYHFGFSDRPTYADAATIAQDAAKKFADGEFDELRIVYTVFKSALSQTPTVQTVLPVEPPKDTKAKKESIIFEPSEDEALSVLAPKYLETLIYTALVQSAASELGSRMTAMSSATDNASKLSAKLLLGYNKARQAGITRELTEICGGVEALKQAQN